MIALPAFRGDLIRWLQLWQGSSIRWRKRSWNTPPYGCSATRGERLYVLRAAGLLAASTAWSIRSVRPGSLSSEEPWSKEALIGVQEEEKPLWVFPP
jgi:hypothetical protein